MEVKGQAVGLMVQDLNHGRARDFSLLQKNIQARYGAHAASYARDTGSKVTGGHEVSHLPRSGAKVNNGASTYMPSWHGQGKRYLAVLGVEREKWKKVQYQ
jgi:hypothetical protein